MSPKRKQDLVELEEIPASPSQSESEDEEVVAINTSKVTFSTILSRILNSKLPESLEQPGYLLAFKEYLDNQAGVEAEIQNLLPGILKVVKVWANNMKRASKKGVEEYLEGCDKLLGITYRMSLIAPQMNMLNNLLNDFKNNLSFTKEEYSSLLSRIIPSTSAMTAHSQMEPVGAPLSKKPRLCLDSDEEIDLDDPVRSAIRSGYPISKTYSSILTNTQGKSVILKSEDQWNEYYMEIKVWKSKNLVGVNTWQEKVEAMRKKMVFHFSDKNTSLMTSLGQLEKVVKQSLLEKGARWAANRYGGWNR
uniref:NS2 n=1 Tax=uncultured densovirus TaxID=748192 RepID=A0A7L7YTW3_9VIRU|nr:NS2 [uncultured densovirus]